jgi:hypothetical protein
VKPAKLVNIGLVVFLLFLLVIIISPPLVVAEDTTGVSWDDDGALLYKSTGLLSAGYYPFAGGSSCCGCATRHYGTLPDDFPPHYVTAVTFFLTSSRSNSYYTSIANGPTTLRLVFTEPEPENKQYSSTSTSIEVNDELTLPVDTPWYITFKFSTSLYLGPGWEWQLLDGDDNIYSAVWLHSSDIDHNGLPGIAETSNCQYQGWRSAWYSVKFGTAEGSADAQYILSLDPTDAWVKPVDNPAIDELLTISGTLLDISGTPVSNGSISIDDPMKSMNTSVTTDNNGAFSYTTYTNRQGVYLLSFVYSKDLKVRNTVLVDVSYLRQRGGRISLFGDIEIRNDDDVPLYVEAKYTGPMTEQEAEKGIITELPLNWLLPIQPGQKWTVLDITDLNTSNIDSTPQHGEQDPEIISVGAEVCPVMFGAGKACIDSSGTVSAQAGAGFEGGAYVGPGGFGITLGIGGNVPYIVEGSAALAIGTDGIHLQGSGGPGVAHGTFSIDLIALAKKRIKFLIESPVDPYLVDTEGRAIGVDPTTGEIVNTIPGATYTGPSSEPQIIIIPADSLVTGEYTLEMEAVAKGEYHVQTEVREGQLADGIVNNVLISSTMISGKVTEGDVVSAVVEYDDSTGTVKLISHSGGSGRMPAWVWIIIVLGVILLAASSITIKRKVSRSEIN